MALQLPLGIEIQSTDLAHPGVRLDWFILFEKPIDLQGTWSYSAQHFLVAGENYRIGLDYWLAD